jgi:hypothetical protein
VILEETDYYLLPPLHLFDGTALSSRHDEDYEAAKKVLREESMLLDVELWWYQNPDAEAGMVTREVLCQELGDLKGKLWQYEHLLADLPAQQHC